MKSTRVNRILFFVLSLSIAIGITSLSRDTVLADTDATTGLTYTIADGAATITGFTAPTGFDGILVIPDTLGGASVTSIGDNAFYMCRAPLTRVTIPDSVTSIGSSSFCFCLGLTSVTIGNGVISIGPGAFALTGLTTITIPASVISIGEGAFLPCSDLISISVTEENSNYTSLEGILYSKDGKTLIQCPAGHVGIVSVPDYVTAIGDDAFRSCYELTSISIPNGVVSIGKQAFYSTGLTRIYIPSSITSIGYWAFYNSFSLTDIDVEISNANFKSVDGVLYSKDGSSLIVCPEAKRGNFVIPDGVTSIEDSAFSWCTSLVNIIIPKSVISIEPAAFNVNRLATVWFQGTVTSIGSYAFNSNNDSIKFIVPTDKITYYQSLLNSNVMADTTAIVTDKFTVIFDINGGIAGVGSDYTQQIAFEGLASAPANPPARIGYIFDGWYEEASCENVWDFNSVVVTTDMTLYAKWRAVAPASPTGMKASSAGYNSNKLTWTAVPGATGYAIYRSTSASSGFEKITTRSSTSYTDTGLTTGTKYYYQVKAYMAVGTTALFGEATIAVGAAPTPAVPTGLTVTSAGYTSDKISWTAVPGATGYTIFRSTSAPGGFVKITTRSTTSYTDTGLTTGTKYYYKVKAYTTVGTKTTFGIATAAVGTAPKPATPLGLKAVRASATSIKLSWTSVTGSTGYAIYRSKSPDSGFTSIATATSASYTNTGLTTGTKYYYQVKAYTTVGTAKVYSVITSAVNATP